ncbi:MAG TPA: hypothetical protein VF808_14315 [Ktedonobacterales bacterium]
MKPDMRNMAERQGRRSLVLARAAGSLLWLYPRAWRARYRNEMLALLDSSPLTLWTLADLAAGAADAHLNRHFLPLEVFSMTQRVRTAANAVLAALALFFIAWVMVPFIGDTRATWDAATGPHPEIRYALLAFQLAGAVAMLALLVGGAPLLAATLRQALRERRRDLGWRLATPLVLGAALIAYSRFAVPNWWLGQRLGPQDLTPTATAFRISFFALTFVFIGLSAWSVASAAGHAQPGAGAVRFTVIPSLIIALALGAGLLALLTLTVLVFADAPQLAGPLWLMPAFDTLALCACLIAGAGLLRMAVPGEGEQPA